MPIAEKTNGTSHNHINFDFFCDLSYYDSQTEQVDIGTPPVLHSMAY